MGGDPLAPSIMPVDEATVDECAIVIASSFATVAVEFGLTRDNAPTHPSFTTPDAVRDACARGIEHFLLREDGGRGAAAGCVAIERAHDDPASFYIERLCVLPGARHRGLGRLLLDFACGEIRSRGGSAALIAIIDGSTVLKRWYAAYGFLGVRTARFRHLPFEVHFMRKDL